MDFIHEGIFLGIDAILLGFCVKEYCGQKQIINALKVCPPISLLASTFVTPRIV